MSVAVFDLQVSSELTFGSGEALVSTSLYTYDSTRSSGSSTQVLPLPCTRVEPFSQPPGVRCHSVHSFRIAMGPL